jgi:hypothetical protein
MPVEIASYLSPLFRYQESADHGAKEAKHCRAQERVVKPFEKRLQHGSPLRPGGAPQIG